MQKNYRVPHTWNYFETQNGKGEDDGDISCVKITIHIEESKLYTKPCIKYVQYIVRWCMSVMGDKLDVIVESTRKRHV